MRICDLICARGRDKLSLHTAASRLLLVLSLLLLAVTPLMEYLWSFDGFLRGGQDLELSIFALLLFLCLVLLMAWNAQHCLSVALTRWLRLVLPDGALATFSMDCCPPQGQHRTPVCLPTIPLRV